MQHVPFLTPSHGKSIANEAEIAANRAISVQCEVGFNSKELTFFPMASRSHAGGFERLSPDFVKDPDEIMRFANATRLACFQAERVGCMIMLDLENLKTYPVPIAQSSKNEIIDRYDFKVSEVEPTESFKSKVKKPGSSNR